MNNAMPKISAIIFDFGGVLSIKDDLADIGRHLAKKYHVPTEVLDKITLRGWFKARINPKYDKAFWKEVAQVLGISVTQLRKEYLSFTQPVPEVVETVRHLRKNYVVGMLSNQIETWHNALMAQWKLKRLFDPIVTSYGEGVAKPDPKIYKRLLKKLKIPANECIYIDDREYNLPPAQELGMQVIHFKTPKSLSRELKKLGVIL